MSKDIPEEVIKAGQVIAVLAGLYLVFKVAQKVSGAGASVGQAVTAVADELSQQYQAAKTAVDTALVQGDNPVNNGVTDVVTAIAGTPETLGGAVYDLTHHPVDTLRAYWRNHFGNKSTGNPSVVTKQGQIVAGASVPPTNDQQMKTLIANYSAYGQGKLSAGGIPAGRPSAQSDVAMGEITIDPGSGAGTSSDQPGNGTNASAGNISLGTPNAPFGIINGGNWDDNGTGSTGATTGTSTGSGFAAFGFR